MAKRQAAFIETVLRGWAGLAQVFVLDALGRDGVAYEPGLSECDGNQ